MTNLFYTCLQSTKDYESMMCNLATGGRFSLNRNHCSEASYDLSGLIKILDIFLKDFENVDFENMRKNLNEMKDPETFVFSNFRQNKFEFVAIDIKPKLEKSWFGFGPTQKIYFNTYLVNMEVSIKSKDKFLKAVNNYVNFEIEDEI